MAPKYAVITVKYRERTFPERFSARNKAGFFAALSNWFVALITGTFSWHRLDAYREAVQATGTITITGADANEYTATINGQDAVLVAGTDGNDPQTASDLAVAINTAGIALINDHVTAAAVGAVVHITATDPGVTGNAITLAAAGTGAVASGPRLTGGTNGTISTYTNP